MAGMVATECADGSLELLLALRRRLEAAFGPDTAAPGWLDRPTPSAGHCAAVAAIALHALESVVMVSARVGGLSHWFIRLTKRDGESIDVDLTGDQFGGPPLQIAPAGSLYADARVRAPDDLNIETLQRAQRLALRAGLPDAARKLERMIDERAHTRLCASS